MSRARTVVATFMLLLLLTACASLPAAPPGPYTVGAQRVMLGRTWADVTTLAPELSKGVRLLSIDGPLLDRLYIAGGLRPGEGVLRMRAKDRPAPVWRADMSASEQVELLADSVAALGYQRVEVTDLRPAGTGAGDGLRITLAARTERGLDIAGLAQLSEIDGRLFVILYLAPAEHYFEAGRPEVERVMASAAALPRSRSCDSP